MWLTVFLFLTADRKQNGREKEQELHSVILMYDSLGYNYAERSFVCHVVLPRPLVDRRYYGLAGIDWIEGKDLLASATDKSRLAFAITFVTLHQEVIIEIYGPAISRRGFRKSFDLQSFKSTSLTFSI